MLVSESLPLATLLAQAALLAAGEVARRCKDYNPGQPRVPAGNADGGQWMATLGPRLTLARGELDILQNRMLIEPTRFSTLESQELINRREIFARNVRNAVANHNLQDEAKWREKLTEAEREIDRRKQLANIKRRIAALEEGISTGKLTVSESEMRQLIASMGDVYFDNGLVRDVGGKSEYNPDLFRTSDLTGARIRFYVILPDGSIVHPDELSDFRGRGRIVVVEDARLTATKATVPDTRRALLAHMEAARKLYRRHKVGWSSAHKVTLDGLPRPLARLIQSLVDAMGAWWDKLAAADMTLREWAATMRDAIIEYHLAGFMAGAGSDVVSDKGLEEVAGQVSVQLDYLNGFKVELQGQDEYAAGAKARAESYAPAIKVPYWTGATRVLPLPAMPAQGTQCMNNCKCLWRVVTLDESAGNYDAFWERHADDSCQTCVERERQWSPVRIRDGVLE